MNIKEQIARIKEHGYDQIHAEARLCQDIVMQALARSTLNQNVTIKGGVVMRSISKNASLFINSKEQMFTEKLRSLLKFGSFSTRYKDIFDMYYLSSLVDKKSLMLCFEKYIFDDTGMKENNLEDIVRRVTVTFKDKNYRKKLKTTETNWLNIDSNEVLNEILCFFTKL